MFLLLPDVLIRSIMSFCHPSDVFTIATRNRRGLEYVEAIMSAAQLNEIRENHQVDSSWNYRLGMQVNQERDRQPATLSNRHMLKCAKETHLYSLGGRDCSSSTNHAVCLPDGNTLITVEGKALQGEVFHVWDLSRQRCLRTFSQPCPDVMLDLTFSDGRIISATSNSLYIFTLDGECLHDIRSCIKGGFHICGSLVACGNKVMQAFFKPSGTDEIYLSLVDIDSGQRIQTVQTWWNHSCLGSMSCAVVGDWYLIACSMPNFLDDEHELRTAEAQAGIHVLNRFDLTLRSRLQGNFKCLKVSDDNESIVAIGRDDMINVLRLKNGTLVRMQSAFNPDPRIMYAMVRRNLMVLSGSLLYIAIHSNGQRCGVIDAILVIDVHKRRMVRSINFSTRDSFTEAHFLPSALVSNGRELFCGFHLGDRRNLHGVGSSLSAIKAYPM